MKRLVYGVIILTVLMAAACFLAQSSEPDYIFLITLDTTRADSVDYAVQNNQWTPNLARLASLGTYFENAYTIIPITAPSHASMFYSLPPHRLGITNNGQVAQIPYPSLARALNSNGFHTSAVVSLGVLKADFGLHHGFVRYNDGFPPYRWSKTAEEVNEKAFEQIDETLKAGNGKAFFWFHYSDPHEPYFPPHLGGDFLILVNGKEVFKAPCSQWPVVDIPFTVNPGENRIILDTVISPGLASYPGYTFEYVKFREFTLLPQENPAGVPGQSGTTDPVVSKDIVVKFPKHWNRKDVKIGSNSTVNYYDDRLRSTLIVQSLKNEPTTVRLRFHYSLQVDDPTRRSLYREEVKYMDHHLGQLFQYLEKKGIYDRSAFIVMGDHGEGLGEYRNHFGHIHYLNGSAVRVPMIISGKGVDNNGKRAGLVSNLDIAPTIFQLAGIDPPRHIMGTSMLASIENKKLLLETYSPEAYFDAFSIIEFPYQLVFYPGRAGDKIEFYNIPDDRLGIAPILPLSAKAKPVQKPAAKPADNKPFTGTPGQIIENKKSGRIKTKKEIAKQEKVRARLVNAITRISRILTATKGKTNSRRTSERHKEILKSLGYL